MNEERAITLFGENSEIAKMMKYLDKQDITLPIYAIEVVNDDLATTLALLGDTQYHHIVCTLNDDVSVRFRCVFRGSL